MLLVVIEACRPRQWVKNLLVFAAPFMARTLNEMPVVIDTTIAFISFCSASSAMYLINDIQDRSADAVHSRKRLRPIASGRLSLQIAGLTAAELIVLASGFVLRALAGATAAHFPPSKWFLLCVLFGSLFIAIWKRCAEMPVDDNGSLTRHVLVWYSSDVLQIMARFVGGLFVLANLGWSIAADHKTDARYVLRIFSALPFAISVARYEYKASGENGESPEDLFASDRVLQLLGVAWFTLVSTSIYMAR